MGRYKLVFGLALVALGSVAVPVPSATGVAPLPVDLVGTAWVANRGTHQVHGFHLPSGVVDTVSMRPGSQPGDLGYARGKLYVAEEFAVPPQIAIVDLTTGERRAIDTGTRPHHVHTSPGGNLVAYGVYGTNRVGIIDTRTDTLIEEWPAHDRLDARVHAGVFSPDGQTVYAAIDNLGKVTEIDPLTGRLGRAFDIPAAHELAVTQDGKLLYVSSRATDKVYEVDLESDDPRGPFKVVAELKLPDTLRVSANGKLVTVGLRAMPAQVAVLRLGETVTKRTVQISEAPATLAGHQWTSGDGRYTIVTFEGERAGVVVLDHDAGDRIVTRLDTAGKPHGVVFDRR